MVYYLPSTKTSPVKTKPENKPPRSEKPAAAKPAQKEAPAAEPLTKEKAFDFVYSSGIIGRAKTAAVEEFVGEFADFISKSDIKDSRTFDAVFPPKDKMDLAIQNAGYVRWSKWAKSADGKYWIRYLQFGRKVEREGKEPRYLAPSHMDVTLRRQFERDIGASGGLLRAEEEKGLRFSKAGGRGSMVVAQWVPTEDKAKVLRAQAFYRLPIGIHKQEEGPTPEVVEPTYEPPQPEVETPVKEVRLNRESTYLASIGSEKASDFKDFNAYFLGEKGSKTALGKDDLSIVSSSFQNVKKYYPEFKAERVKAVPGDILVFESAGKWKAGLISKKGVFSEITKSEYDLLKDYPPAQRWDEYRSIYGI